MLTDDHSPPLLAVDGVTKHFAGVRALAGVTLEVRAGEVHCILGQNGAGKSTLIKILSGVHAPDAGELRLDGEPTVIADPISALRLGIATIYQELDVVGGLSIAENIFLGHEKSRLGFSRRREALERSRELLSRLGHGDLPPNREVSSLSAAHQQIVSLARALSRNTRVIIMDEPSAVLDSAEVGNLFRVVRELAATGIAVIYITHRLEEIRQIGDRITVIKDGATMATGLDAATPTAELIRLMTGRTVANVFPAAVPVPADAPLALTVSALALRGVFSGLDFSLREGEIVGLAGLVGSGRSEMLETIYGARKSTGGSVAVSGRVIRSGSIEAAVAGGIGLSPEERKSQGLLLAEPVYHNVTLSSFWRFARLALLNERAERAAAVTQLTALDLRPADPDQAAGLLSGGNQQKILLARWLVHGTRVLLLDEPTRGVDVGARSEIYALIRRLAAAGTAIVIVSSEIEEVIGLSDRVLVIGDGQVLHVANAKDLTERDVLEIVMRAPDETVPAFAPTAERTER